MRASIIAREAEIHQLDTLMEEELPQFVAVRCPGLQYATWGTGL